MRYPDYGLISHVARTGRSSYHALQTALRGASQPLAGVGHLHAVGIVGCRVAAVQRAASGAVPDAPDLGGEFTLGQTDQRHRAVFNGIWQVGRGFQVSGLFYLGVGERSQHVYGGDLRGIGGGGRAQALRRQRLRPDGTIIDRNSFTQPRRQRVDLGLQQRVPVRGFTIDGIVEVFNVFNSPNWTLNTDQANRQYNQRIAGENRTAQVGFRVTF